MAPSKKGATRGRLIVYETPRTRSATKKNLSSVSKINVSVEGELLTPTLLVSPHVTPATEDDATRNSATAGKKITPPTRKQAAKKGKRNEDVGGREDDEEIEEPAKKPPAKPGKRKAHVYDHEEDDEIEELAKKPPAKPGKRKADVYDHDDEPVKKRVRGEVHENLRIRGEVEENLPRVSEDFDVPLTTKYASNADSDEEEGIDDDVTESGKQDREDSTYDDGTLSGKSFSVPSTKPVNPLTGEALDPWHDVLDNAVKVVFREIKFTPRDKEINALAEKIMNYLDSDKLKFRNGMTTAEKLEVASERTKFRLKYEKHWRQELNRHRTYVQVRENCDICWQITGVQTNKKCLGCKIIASLRKKSQMKDAAMKLLVDDHVAQLPDPAIFDKILARDDSDYKLRKGDSDLEKEDKERKKQLFILMFDFYVDKMLSATAGRGLWSNQVKCQEEVSKSLVPNSSKLRVPPSTEAFAVLCYKNCWRKWNAMHRDKKAWKRLNKGGKKWKCPSYNKKNPTLNVDYKTEFTDATSGKNPKGGFNKAAMKEFVRLQKFVTNARGKSGAAARFSRVEAECVARLREIHNHDETKKPKEKKAEENDDELSDWVDEEY